MAVVEMEPIQIGVNVLGGRLGLQGRSIYLQLPVFCRFWRTEVSTGHFVSLAEQANSRAQSRGRVLIEIAAAWEMLWLVSIEDSHDQ